jgi:hypothetical protein
MARIKRRRSWRRNQPLAPLRDIVGRSFDEFGIRLELLECGHEQRQKHDIFGPTNACRRRCRQCLNGGGEARG